MEILGILYHLQEAYSSNRQAGHTTFARKIAEVGGVVICANEQQAAQVGRLLGRKHPKDESAPLTVSMQNLDWVQARKVPLVVDNFAVMKICELGIARIQQQDNNIKRITAEWHKQNLEYDDKLQKLGSEIYELRHYTIGAKDIQIDAGQREILSLKIQLNAAKAANVVRHIRVTRPNKKRRR